MSEKTAKPEDRAQSPYWIGRHKKRFLGSLAVLGIAAAAGFSWLGISQERDSKTASAIALKRDRACLQVIDDRAPAGSATATVRLASLSPKQQVDCRVADLPLTVNVSDTYSALALRATIVNPVVELPSKQSLRVAEAQDFQGAQAAEYGGIPVDIAMGGLAIPVMVTAMTALVTGDYRGVSGETPPRRQTTISA